MSSTNNLNDDEFFQLRPAKSLVDAFDYILLFDAISKSTNVDKDKRKLINLELDIKQNPSKLRDLIKMSADDYKIDLQIIAYPDAKLEIIDKSAFLEANKLEKQAFIIFNSNYTICGPLFAHDKNGIQTTFAIDDMRIKHFINKYIEKINQISLINYNEIENQLSSAAQDVSNDMMVDKISTSTNDSNPENPVQFTNTINSNTSYDQAMQQICQLYTTLSHARVSIPLGIKTSEVNIDNCNCTSLKKVGQTLVEELQNFSRSIQTALEHIPDHEETVNYSIVAQDTIHDRPATDGLNDVALAMQNMRYRSTASSLPLNSLSTTTQVTSIVQTPVLPHFSYTEPKIIIEPKDEWHLRYMKDVGKREMPLLAGVGPQRTPIRVRVPAASGCRMYLCITPFTFCDQAHPVKVIVPANTKIDERLLSHENKLQCLLFTECNSADHFDLFTRCVYLEISAAEHEAQYKDIRILMFNLYQNSSITKKMIKAEQLNLCKLGFRLCVMMDGKLQAVSSWSFSQIIRDEQKKCSQSRTRLGGNVVGRSLRSTRKNQKNQKVSSIVTSHLATLLESENQTNMPVAIHTPMY